MARIINFSMEVTDEEFANFLSRASGADGRKVTSQIDAQEDEGPANATDKNGVEWDERFHASSKAVNADGTWRRKRGLSPEETAAADAYEKGTVGNAPAETPSIHADSVAPTPSAPVVPSEPAPALPVATPELPAAPVTMPGLPTAAPVTYEELVALFGQAVAKDASVSANFAELYAKAGVTDPQVLNTDAGAEQRIALAGLLREIIEG